MINDIDTDKISKAITKDLNSYFFELLKKYNIALSNDFSNNDKFLTTWIITDEIAARLCRGGSKDGFLSNIITNKSQEIYTEGFNDAVAQQSHSFNE